MEVGVPHTLAMALVFSSLAMLSIANARFQAYVVKQMRSARFWDITQPIVVITCRHFGTNQRSRNSVQNVCFAVRIL